MNWKDLVDALFGNSHTITRSGDVVSGEARLRVHGSELTITVVGTTDHAEIGVETALAQAKLVLETVSHYPGRPMVLLVDTQGQRLRRRDEMLGLNRYMAHLGCCVDLARRQGHRVIGLVYDQALSGGFITSGLMADACYALPEAEIRVMRLPAMSRVTKISEDLLRSLSESNPVFAPGVENYVAMGGIQSLWTGDLKQCLVNALADPNTIDIRTRLGADRGGRALAERVVHQVITDEGIAAQ